MATSSAAQTTAPAEMPELGPIPEIPVKGGVVAYLNVSDTRKATAFYAEAFGAEEKFRLENSPDGRSCHVHLYINGSSVMLSDPFPEHGCGHAPAQGFTLHQMVTDIDAKFQRAIDAGAEVVMPVQKMFWGDRYGQLRDPFGIVWSMGEPDPQ